MSPNENQNPQEKKPIDGKWVLLLFGLLFTLVFLLGWLAD